MELSQPETIQILRRRMNLNQGTFGSLAFDTSFESGRTKIKNIELGRQRPTADDLRKMAAILQVPVSILMCSDAKIEEVGTDNAEEISLNRLTQSVFPGLAPYFEMLNNAVMINDQELIEHISDKIAQIFRGRGKAASAKPRALTLNKR